MTSTILVTGAAGFIGMHVSALLAGDGHRVVGVDNLNDYYDPALKRARLAAGDESQPAAVFSCEREGDTELTVRASAEGASTEEAVPAHVDGLLPPTGLALTYLADALEALGADSVTLVARSPRAAVVLEPAQPDPHVNVTCVVMPRRV